jgi:hypothetical protein
LKRYKLKHGEWPKALDALVTEFLSSVPRDCMSGKPLGYHLATDRTFVLYSVGEDGKDDNGDPNPRDAAGVPGMWNGRDVVWPQPDEGTAD